MTNLESAQLCFLLVATALFVIFRLYQIARPRRPDVGVPGHYFRVAASSSVFLPRLSKFVDKGDMVLVPSGAGRYPLRLSYGRRRRWEKAIELWCAKGAHVTFLISSPNVEARAHCLGLMQKAGPNFVAYFLYRARASPLDKIEIENLDTFHPTLVLRRTDSGLKPIAMWLEAYHPLNSKFAYQCEFIGPTEIGADLRAEKYSQILLRLLGLGGEVGHLEKIEPEPRKGVAANDAA